MSSTVERVARLRKRVEAAAARSGRRPEDIQLVVASKYAGIAEMREAVAAGLTVFGENRAQDLVRKKQALGTGVSWHFIGHLQRNKVKYVVPVVDLIHSLDSLALAEEIERKAADLGKVQQVLIEVNVSLEETKYGVSPGDLLGFASELAKFPHLQIKGLMCIAPFLPPEEVRPYFVRLRELAAQINEAGLPFTASELSMGMTNDFDVAIEEGSTMIRVGSAIFKEDVNERDLA